MTSKKYEYQFKPSADARRVFGRDNRDYQLFSDIYSASTADGALSSAFGRKGLPAGAVKEESPRSSRTVLRLYLKARTMYNMHPREMELGFVERVEVKAEAPPQPAEPLPLSAAEEKARGGRGYYQDFFLKKLE